MMLFNNAMILVAMSFFASNALATTTTSQLTKEIFLKADPAVYTEDFCKKIKSIDFISSIKAEIKEVKPCDNKNKDRKEKKLSAKLCVPKREIIHAPYDEMSKAFKTLFQKCSSSFFHANDAMIQSIIVDMLNTDNVEYLPIFLDRSDPLDRSKLNNINMEAIFDVIIETLFAPQVNPSEDKKEFYFNIRHPHRALEYLLAYTTIPEGKLKGILTKMEAAKNLAGKGQYVDAGFIEKTEEVVGRYIKAPLMIGDHSVMISHTDAEVFTNSHPSSASAVTASEKEKEKVTGGVWNITVIVIGCIAVLAIALGLIWKGGNKDSD